VEWSRGKVFKRGAVSRDLGVAPPRLRSRCRVFVSNCKISKKSPLKIRCYTCKFDTIYEKNFKVSFDADSWKLETDAPTSAETLFL
jgi:hypothetical protein